MIRWWNTLSTHKLLVCGILIHILFYISAIWTGWLNPLVSSPAQHYRIPGIDFYQVVRGAWAFWHGGSLTGAPLPNGQVYAPVPYWVNANVYHPFFTVAIGSLLMQLSPGASYTVWMIVKLLADSLLIGLFWKTVRGYRGGQLATFLLLANFGFYAELVAGQYHFVLNACLLLFLLMLRKASIVGCIATYAASLLVKPVGLLFVPALLIKRRWKIVLLALALVVMATWPYLLNRSGNYYIDNLITQFSHPDNAGPDQILTLNALLRHTFGWPNIVYQALQYGVLALITLLSAIKRTALVKSIFFSIAYFLLFYSLVYEYDWSSLAPIVAVCLVFCADFQSRVTRACALLLCLPSCFLLLRVLHIDVSYSDASGYVPGVAAWRWMVLSKVVPLVALMVSVLAPEARLAGKWIQRRACRVFRKVEREQEADEEERVTQVV